LAVVTQINPGARLTSRASGCYAGVLQALASLSALGAALLPACLLSISADVPVRGSLAQSKMAHSALAALLSRGTEGAP